MLAGVERMTRVADVHGQFILGRTCLKRASARTGNRNDRVLGVDAFLHIACLLLRGEADPSSQSLSQQAEVRF
jgi:hypothetical protein